MRMRTIVATLSLFALCALAQQATSPALRVRIIVDKDTFVVGEKVFVKTELTNLTSKTLCFPVPDPACSNARTGWIVTTGQPVISTAERDKFICHVDGRGKVGAELASEIKNLWIKLPSNAAYVANATEGIALSEGGVWQFTASYHPPEGSFAAEYKSILQSAAQKAGCQLPDSTVVAEPKLIRVRSADARPDNATARQVTPLSR
jgi:hypothetical protein